ncbi:hypothetical protein [Streptomyces sp. NBC_01750]|nr:hypothetical protein [Streptomyces sp. NBC_01750]WSD37515.1 hypothetical protein OG966_39905 [Streptomyces sp. NBC_01750]
MSVTAWLTVAVFATVYVLIATERVHRVTAALGARWPCVCWGGL